MDDTQIQVQAPPTLATPDDAQIVIVHQGSIAARSTSLTAAAAPALFPIDPQAVKAAPAQSSLYMEPVSAWAILPVTADYRRS